MKKNYEEPELTVYEVESTSHLCDVSDVPIGGEGGADAKTSDFIFEDTSVL